RKTTVGAQTATEKFSYAGQSNRLAAITQSSTVVRQFAYAASGNIVQDSQPTQTLGLTYNDANRLVSVSKDANTAADYTYDAFGDRLVKTVPGATRLYQYGPGGILLEELANGPSGAVPQPGITITASATTPPGSAAICKPIRSGSGAGSTPICMPGQTRSRSSTR